MPAPLGYDWWWDASWNPVGGCSYVSPGCKNCFVPSWLASHTHTHREDIHRDVITRANGRAIFNSKLTALPDGHPLWTWPLTWLGAERPKLGPGKPSLIFVADMSDLFHEQRPDEIIDRVCATIALSDHIGLLITKRTRRMAEYFAAQKPHTVLWLGFSTERQQEFDERWPDMCALAGVGWKVFVSIAPMLGPVTLPADFLALGRRTWCIASGEQRIPHTCTRDMDPNWARGVRDQCAPAGHSLFHETNGERRTDPARFTNTTVSIGVIGATVMLT
jgi:protein gp37